MQLFFWGNEIVLYMSERSKLQFFMKSGKQLLDRPWQKALTLQLKAPNSMAKYIFLLLERFVIYNLLRKYNG